MRIDRLVSYIRSSEYGRDRAQFRAASHRVPESLRVYMECRTLAYFLALVGAMYLLAVGVAVAVGPLIGSTVSATDTLIALFPGLSSLGIAAFVWSAAVAVAREKANRESEASGSVS